MHVPSTFQSMCWFVFVTKWTAVNDSNSVWSSTSLCALRTSLGEAMTSQWSNLRALFFIDAFVNKFNSKHDVTMIRGSLATVRTCTDYSGNNVRSFFSTWGRHDTLFLLTNFCWVHYWTKIATCVSDFHWAIKRKCIDWQSYTAVPVAFIYDCRHCDHHQQHNNYISNFIMISKILEYQSDLHFISLLVLKNEIFE